MNSRAEFNRCHIPRLVVEEEEEGAKKARLKREEQELLALKKSLEQEDMSWEERKQREQEIILKKRRRETVVEEDNGEQDVTREQGGVTPTKKRAKRLRYAKLEDGWGEDGTRRVGGGQCDKEDYRNIVMQSTPVTNRLKRTRDTLTGSSIADYFERTPKVTKRRRMDINNQEPEFDDMAGFEELTEDCTNLRGEGYHPGSLGLVKDGPLLVVGEEDTDVWGCQEDQEDWLDSTQSFVDSVLGDHHAQVRATPVQSQGVDGEGGQDDPSLGDHHAQEGEIRTQSQGDVEEEVTEGSGVCQDGLTLGDHHAVEKDNRTQTQGEVEEGCQDDYILWGSCEDQEEWLDAT